MWIVLGDSLTFDAVDMKNIAGDWLTTVWRLDVEDRTV